MRSLHQYLGEALPKLHSWRGHQQKFQKGFYVEGKRAVVSSRLCVVFHPQSSHPQTSSARQLTTLDLQKSQNV